MAGETIITVVGNLTNDPELRFTPSGAAVASFTVASTPRTFDRNTNEWKDGDTLFMSCSVWRQSAENVAESLTKGMRVIVQGSLKQRSYETRDGEKRTVVEMTVEEIGPALKSATAKVTRASRGAGGGGFGGGGGDNSGGAWGGGQGGNGGNTGDGYGGNSGGNSGGGGNQQQQQQAPRNSAPQQDDPWATGGGSGGNNWGGGYSDEPPF